MSTAPATSVTREHLHLVRVTQYKLGVLTLRFWSSTAPNGHHKSFTGRAAHMRAMRYARTGESPA